MYATSSPKSVKWTTYIKLQWQSVKAGDIICDETPIYDYGWNHKLGENKAFNRTFKQQIIRHCADGNLELHFVSNVSRNIQQVTRKAEGVKNINTSASNNDQHVTSPCTVADGINNKFMRI